MKSAVCGLNLMKPTLDGEPGCVLSLTIYAACSADVNTFITLLDVFNPGEGHKELQWLIFRIQHQYLSN